MEKEHREAEAFLAPNIACGRRTNERPATAFQTNGDFGLFRLRIAISLW
jgi:hypothetical protein